MRARATQVPLSTVSFAEKDKGIHTIHYTLIVVGGAAGGVVLLFFLYMLVSRNQHFEEVDLRLSPVRFHCGVRRRRPTPDLALCVT